MPSKDKNMALSIPHSFTPNVHPSSTIIIMINIDKCHLNKTNPTVVINYSQYIIIIIIITTIIIIITTIIIIITIIINIINITIIITIIIIIINIIIIIIIIINNITIIIMIITIIIITIITIIIIIITIIIMIIIMTTIIMIIIIMIIIIIITTIIIIFNNITIIIIIIMINIILHYPPTPTLFGVSCPRDPIHKRTNQQVELLLHHQGAKPGEMASFPRNHGELGVYLNCVYIYNRFGGSSHLSNKYII